MKPNYDYLQLSKIYENAVNRHQENNSIDSHHEAVTSFGKTHYGRALAATLLLALKEMQRDNNYIDLFREIGKEGDDE